MVIHVFFSLQIDLFLKCIYVACNWSLLSYWIIIFYTIFETSETTYFAEMQIKSVTIMSAILGGGTL
jgi:hypothetical protein